MFLTASLKELFIMLNFKGQENKMNYKILSFAILGIFLFSLASAMTVYGDFSDATQSKTINQGQSITFNVDFFSMNPPMTIKAELYQGNNLIYIFLNTNTNSRTYYNTYSYTANSVGSFEIRVTGTDKVNTDSEYLTLVVNSIPQPPTNNAPVITSNPVTSVTEGNYYNYDVDATDSDGNTLTYSLTQSPNWLSINSATGLITGTAPSNLNQNTPFSITVQVSDGTDIDTQSYTLTVLDIPQPPTNNAPVITSNPVTSVTEGNYYNYDVDATDSDNDNLVYSITQGPGWLTINPNTGDISGTAPLVSSSTDYTVAVEVSDGNSGIDTQSYTLRVKNYVSGSSSGGSSRVISDSDIYYQNRYFDQFNNDVVLYTKPKTQNLFGLSALTFFYFLITLISLGIILVVFLLARNLRR